MLTVKEAREKILSFSKTFGAESVRLQEALGRVVAEDIITDRDYPPFNRSAMDGYAINSYDFTTKKIRNYTVIKEIFAGSSCSDPIPSGSCVKIMTGASVPDDADTVIRIEDTLFLNNTVKINIDSIKKYQNISLKGEDLKTNERILKKGTLLSPTEISALAVVGKNRVKVYTFPTMAVISTGNEVKLVNERISRYEIRDSNSHVLKAFLKKYQIPVAYTKLVRDEKEELLRSVQEALNCDVVITTGGVSMGDADFLPEVFTELGVDKVFHKVQVKPGKPLWFGHSSNSLVFGLPGNPVSVQVAFKIFIEPFIRKCFGLEESLFLKLPLLHSKKKKAKFDEYFPCKIETSSFSGLKAIDFNGSGDISATLNSHGIALHPGESGDLNPGDLLNFFPWKVD